jgi:hypothetical protein
MGISTGLRYKHYLNLSPHGWNIASRQAGMEDSDKVRGNTHHSSCSMAGNMPSIPGLLYGAKNLLPIPFLCS